jgi:hypothetical protein
MAVIYYFHSQHVKDSLRNYYFVTVFGSLLVLDKTITAEQEKILTW